MRTPCRFYNTPRGCNKGDSCPFPHEISTAGVGSVTRGNSGRGRGGRANITGRGEQGSNDRTGRSSSADYGLFTKLLQDLGSNLDLQLPAATVQRWVQLALQRCDRGDAQQVLQHLRRDDGANLLRAVALQLTLPELEQSCSQFVGVVVPVLKLLTKEAIRSDPAHSNPVLATLHQSLQLSDLATVLQHLNNLPAAAAPDYFRLQRTRAGTMPMTCLPTDWLDVLQPIAIYLQEVTQRFSSMLQQQPEGLTAAKALLDVLASALQQHLPADSLVARSKTVEWRRLLTSTALLQRQINAHQDASKVVEQLQQMRARFDAQQKQQSAAAAAAVAAGGPGELNPGGRRHDNDKVNHLDISVAPTRDEVLCSKPPFLPPNRPGSLPHASHDPDRAHRELHFRLLRHDVVSPVSDAAHAFRQFGGVAGLKSIKNQTPGFSTRLHLKAGRDYQDLYVFRNVAILGLTSTFSGGIAYKVEFDDAPQLANATLARRRDWWAHTKQLQHGSLAALWWDGDSAAAGTTGSSSSSSGAGPLPHIMFATVCERDEKLLAPAGEPCRRPQLGLRMCAAAVTTELMAAVLGRQRLGGKKEVVLLPAAGGFFAYEPILKALQATHPLPLARYILHDGGPQAAGAAPVLFRGELVGGVGCDTNMGMMQVPAYAAGADCCYDMSPVISQEKLKDLSSEDISRLQRVCISSPGSVPLELLLRASSLDPSQAAALAACLTKELAVVQGPPGCGKTYVGVQLVRALLANTRTSAADHMSRQELQLSSIPTSLRPDIGPILVLCYTNHALDSFLLDLVHAGITEGIVRVGRRSSCAELEPYNLRNQEGGQARGAEVGRCRARVEKLKDQVNELLERLKASRKARRLRWDDVQQWLERQHPALLEAFSFRAAEMEQVVFLQATALTDQEDSDGFTVATSKRHRRQHKQPQHGAGGPDGRANVSWVWGEDVLQDWLHSSPVQDWQREQWMWDRAQQWENEAAWGQEQSYGQAADVAAPLAAAAALNGSQSSKPGAAAGGGSAIASTNNPFAALEGFADMTLQDDVEVTEAVAGPSCWSKSVKSGPEAAVARSVSTGPAAVATAAGGEGPAAASITPTAAQGSVGTSSSVPIRYGEWMLLVQPAESAAEGSSAAHPGLAGSDDGDGWELAERSESDTESAAAEDASLATVSSEAENASCQQQPQQMMVTRPQCSSNRAEGAAAAAADHDDSLHHGDAADTAAALLQADAGATSVPTEVQLLEGLERPVEDLLLLDDITAMSRSERGKLYQHWLNTLAVGWGSEISDLVQQLEQEQQTLKGLYDAASLQVLRSARIVGMTTTGLANQQSMLHGLQPKVVIVEEAAEVLEAHILTSLTPTVEHLILIGDHLQLPPKVEVYELQKESGRGYNLNMSIFERLVESGAVQHNTLQQQRRMRPEIAELIRGPLYPQLRDHPAVTAYPHVSGMAKDLFFWDHNHKEGGTDASKSRFNEYEVEACVGLARYLLQQGYGGRDKPNICILTPYVGQLLKLRQAVAAVSGFKVVMSERDQADLAHVITDASMADGAFDSGYDAERTSTGSSDTAVGTGATAGAEVAGNPPPSAASLAGAGSRVVTLGSSLRLATIDNFQGEEARVIILSLVRNPREDGTGIGFLAVNNRINVLLSRAKEGMYLIGSSHALYAAAEKAAAAGRSCMWSSVLDHLDAIDALGPSLQVCCRRHSNTTDINHPRDFTQLVGDGGCQQACGLKLPCGHTCPRRCHADDPLHTQTKCFKPCGKLCARGRHPCERLCYEPCVKCTAPEEQVLLPCGHTASNVPCHKAAEPGSIPCTQLVTVTVPGCGHRLTVPCSKRADFLTSSASCTQLVQIVLPACGHSMTLPCAKAAVALLDPTQCSRPCGGLLPGCEHTCSSSCGKCMNLRLQPAQHVHGTKTSATAAAADPIAAAAGLIELFLQQLQSRGPVLCQIWSDWSLDATQGGAGALQQEQLLQRWQRFLHDKITAVIGTKQCALVGTAVSATSSSTSSSNSSKEQWERYLSSCLQTNSITSAEEQIAAEWQVWLLNSNPSRTGARSSISRLHGIHTPCNMPCQKPLACGHNCQSTCHHGSSCAPCKQPCSIACEHGRCHQSCAAPCAPCAEPCGWWCEHKGGCLLPCGVPCDREPCNVRCSKLLPCGHRCPGLCGEACLPAKYCTHPACLVKAPQSVKHRVVDMLLFKTFGELTDADVTADPLILLPCGHLFITSTLDGHMAMAEAYGKARTASGSDGAGSSSSSNDLEAWGAPVSRDDFPAPKACPDCRRVISTVRRYGRVVLHSQLGMTQRKHAEAIRCELKGSFERLAQLQDQLLSSSAPWRDNVTAAAARTLIAKKKPLGAGLLSAIEHGAVQAWNVGLRFNQLVAAARRTPKQYVVEAHKAALMSAVKAGQLSRAAAAERWTALDAFSGKRDLHLALEAVQGNSGAMHLSLSLITRQLEACATGLECLESSGGAYEEGVDLAPGFAARGGRNRRQLQGKADWFTRQTRDLEGQVHRLVASSAHLFEATATDLNWAIATAAADACYTNSYKLSHCLMLLCVQRASQLQPLKKSTLAHLLSRHTTAQQAASLPHELAHQQRLRDLQQQLLTQAEQAGTAAVQLYAQQKQRLLVEAGDDWEEQQAVLDLQDSTIQKVEGLLSKMAGICAELAGEVDAAEVAAVLGALMQAEGRYYSGLGLANFMAGHLYECPNGHLFVIGECGGAMQVSRCDRCGARIGGRSHQLDASNRRANTALVGAVLQAAAGSSH